MQLKFLNLEVKGRPWKVDLKQPLKRIYCVVGDPHLETEHFKEWRTLFQCQSGYFWPSNSV
jgi:hypothetical protein